jgi:leucyl/phenylalanyl-tRNA---protein transferase
MTIESFPPHESADLDGLLAFGGDLEVTSLLLAYRNGIFPWPLSEDLLAWFSPPKRAVLFLDQFHVSKSLQKELKNCKFEFCISRDFAQVIDACSEFKNRKHQRGTWITDDIKAAYINLHLAGYAFSFECWEDDLLVGGGYGVSIDGKFAGESLFYRKPNASKIAFYYLVEYLKSKGLEWIDCQVINSFTRSLGACEVTRQEFHRLLGLEY